MNTISFTGGARIGWVNASWPLARLTCDGVRLTLASLGKYEFTADQVVSFGTYGSVPLLANGLRINHNRTDCPEKVVFWCMGSRDAVLEAIKQTGFGPRGHAVERPKGFPLRWSFVIACLLLWNLLFLLDGIVPLGPNRAPPFNWGSLSALALAFILACAVQWSTRLQGIVLRPGHSIGEVRAALALIQLIAGPMAFGFGLAWWLSGQ